MWLPILASLFLVGGDLPDLEQLRDHYRVLLLFADSQEQKSLQDQRKVLSEHQADLDERDTKVFSVIGAGAQQDSLRRQFGVSGKDPFSVVVIGKDGGRKLRKVHPITADELFDLIDSMPMRKNEMRQRE